MVIVEPGDNLMPQRYHDSELNKESPPTDAVHESYPEGGRRAWAVVFGVYVLSNPLGFVPHRVHSTAG